MLQTSVLLDPIAQHEFDAAFGGGRWRRKNHGLKKVFSLPGTLSAKGS